MKEEERVAKLAARYQVGGIVPERRLERAQLGVPSDVGRHVRRDDACVAGLLI